MLSYGQKVRALVFQAGDTGIKSRGTSYVEVCVAIGATYLLHIHHKQTLQD